MPLTVGDDGDGDGYDHLSVGGEDEVGLGLVGVSLVDGLELDRCGEWAAVGGGELADPGT